MSADGFAVFSEIRSCGQPPLALRDALRVAGPRDAGSAMITVLGVQNGAFRVTLQTPARFNSLRGRRFDVIISGRGRERSPLATAGGDGSDHCWRGHAVGSGLAITATERPCHILVAGCRARRCAGALGCLSCKAQSTICRGPARADRSPDGGVGRCGKGTVDSCCGGAPVAVPTTDSGALGKIFQTDRWTSLSCSRFCAILAVAWTSAVSI